MQQADQRQAPARLSRRGGRPTVSFFLAGRNVEDYVEDAVRSMLRQTFDDFEIVFLDDASTDSTLEIVKSIADPRLKVVRNEEWLGIPRSLNRLLDMLQGEFWAHMDADDISLPERLELQVALLRDNLDICVCGCRYRLFTPTGKVFNVDMPLGNDEIRAALLFRCPLAHPFVTFRGEFLRKNEIKYAEKMKYALDYELWVRIALRHPEAHFCNQEQPFGLYRQHAQQVTTAKTQEQALMATRAQMQIFLALGFPPTSKLIAAHRFIYHHSPVQSPTEMDQVFEWCSALRQANAASGLFPRRVFEEELARALLQIILEYPHSSGKYMERFFSWLQSLNED